MRPVPALTLASRLPLRSFSGCVGSDFRAYRGRLLLYVGADTRPLNLTIL
jgi:hypothetical protein